MSIRKINKAVAKRIITRPSSDISKRDAGSILIVAGMGGMAGAAILSSLAGLRAGAGLVRVAVPNDLRPAINAAVPEAITVNPKEAFANLDSFDSIAFGPGMGRLTESRKLLEKLLRESAKPLVIDADGLNLISESGVLKKLVSGYGGELVLTPHRGEAGRLLGIEPGSMDRTEMAIALYEAFGHTVLLKGEGTIVTDGNDRHINTTGNPGMATAGSGDVLTGIITAFSGRGFGIYDSSLAGCYIHGKAGDMAAEEKGVYGMIAGDIVQKIPHAIKETIVL